MQKLRWWKALDGVGDGPKCREKLVQAVWFTNNQGMITNLKERLKKIMIETNRVIKKYETKVNI